MRLADVDVEEYAGVIMPCMSVGMPGPVPAEAVALVKKAHALGIPLAAHDGNIYILDAAGLLTGLKYACHASLFLDGICVGNGVALDDNIITSSGDPGSVRHGYADQTTGLTNLLISAMKGTQ